MRIAIICRNYPPAICGVGDHTYFIAREMALAGHEVTVITTERDGIRHHEGITVRAISDEWNASAIGRITSELADVGPEAVYLQYVPHMYGRAGIAPWVVGLAREIRRQFDARFLVIFHELYVPWAASARLLAGGIIHRWQAAALISLGHASAVTTPLRLRTMRAWMPGHARRIVEVPVGSNIPVMPISEGERSDIRQRFGAAGSPLIGAFGTLKPDERNHDLLYESLAMLRKAHPAAKLVWIGSVDKGSRDFAVAMEKAVEFGVDEMIHWTGCLEADEVSRHLSALDVFISLQTDGPCFRRGSLLAAMDHGLPIVALDGRARDPRLIAGNHLLLVGRFAESVSKGISETLNSPELSARLQANVRALSVKYLQWDSISRQLLELATQERVLRHT